MKRLIWYGLLLSAIFVMVRVGQTARTALQTPEYWRAQARQPVPAGAFRLVMLGDSSAQAIGAARPHEGVAGLAAQYVQQMTGRPVHITNLAVGGATVADILQSQLPQADVQKADLILISTANDLEQRVPLAKFETNLRRLLAQLPTQRTIISDFPLEPGRPPYQAILSRQADQRGIRRADFAGTFRQSRSLLIFSWLPPHLNSRGYALWFRAFQPGIADVLRRSQE